MQNRLHVLVRLDIDRTFARIEVSGGLSPDGCQSLFSIIDRTRDLIDGLPVVVDFSNADHIDKSALEKVRQFAARQMWDEDHPPQLRQAATPVVVEAPATEPAAA